MEEQGQSAAGPANSLFRGAALERLNSAEQLDQRIAVVPPGMRVMAVAATLIVAAAMT